MRQSKYGVVKRGNVDEPYWLGDGIGSSVKKIAETALSEFNKNDTTAKSIVYIPQNGDTLPIFMCLSNGRYGTSGKNGLVHLMYGRDAIEDENYAAAIISSDKFVTALSNDELKASPSASDGFNSISKKYNEIKFSGLSKVLYVRPDYVCEILDGLFLGKQVFVSGASLSDIENAVSTALMWLPVEYSNQVSFNTYATTSAAASRSMLCGISSALIDSNYERIKSGEVILVDLTRFDKYSSVSAYCKLLEIDSKVYFNKNDNEMDLLELTYLKYHPTDRSLRRLDEASRAVYLHYCCIGEENADDKYIGMEALENAVIELTKLPCDAFDAINSAHKQLASEDFELRDEIVAWSIETAEANLFSSEFYNFSPVIIDAFENLKIFERLDAVNVNVINAREIVLQRNPAEQLMYYQFLLKLLKANSGFVDMIYAAFSELFLANDEGLRQVSVQIASSITKAQFAKIWTLAQQSNEFVSASQGNQSDRLLKTIRECVSLICPSADDKRNLYMISPGDSWLFYQGFTQIESLEDADVWLENCQKSINPETHRYCAKKFEQFCAKTSPNEDNYLHYESLYSAFECTDTAIVRRINACKDVKNEQNLSAVIYAGRRKYLRTLARFQKANGIGLDIPDDLLNSDAVTMRSADGTVDYGKKIELAANHMNPDRHRNASKRIKTQSDFSLIRSLLTIIICLVMPTLLSMILMFSGLPLEILLSDLPEILSLIIRVAILGIPIIASCFVGILSYLKSEKLYDSRKCMQISIRNAVFWINLPYLVFIVSTLLLYYVIL